MLNESQLAELFVRRYAKGVIFEHADMMPKKVFPLKMTATVDGKPIQVQISYREYKAICDKVIEENIADMGLDKGKFRELLDKNEGNIRKVLQDLRAERLAPAALDILNAEAV